MDHAPLVAVSGQSSTVRMHKESHQYLNLVNLFRPISKYSIQVVEPETIPEVVRKAFKQAQAEKPGVSFIDFPENVANMELADGDPLALSHPMRSMAAAGRIQQAVEILSKAKYPLILAGNGVIRSRAVDRLVRFAERLNIPVVNTFMAKGVVPFSHPLWLGTVGLQRRRRGGLRLRPRGRDRLRGLRHGRVPSQPLASRQASADHSHRFAPRRGG